MTRVETIEDRRTDDRTELGQPPVVNLPAVIPVPTPKRRPRRWLKFALIALLLAGGAAGGAYWWRYGHTVLPVGIASGNGRLEADEIDIATKFAGRISTILADEGDIVRAGQVVARMDTLDQEASLRRAEAKVQEAQKAIESARADLAQAKSRRDLAEQQLQRALFLTQKGYQTKEMLDMRHSEMSAASAACDAAAARIGEAEQAFEATRQEAALIRVNMADNILVVPRDGRIQYRLANVGEVLPAGGKVFTMLDTAYVYMDVFLPTAEAGQVTTGSDARIVLDAAPQQPIPATVTFIAAQAQFTPKTVETRSERDKLMFRVRVRVDPERLKAHRKEAPSGLPGVAYIRLDPAVQWPALLQIGPTG